MKSPMSKPLGLSKMVGLDQIKPNPHNARTHSKKQKDQLKDSMLAFGFTAPVLIDENGVLIAVMVDLKPPSSLDTRKFRRS
jgi:hypothetical protein